MYQRHNSEGFTLSKATGLKVPDFIHKGILITCTRSENQDNESLFNDVDLRRLKKSPREEIWVTLELEEFLSS
ncbi:hypothetical protein [Parasitella parasitica]|uniref:Uncharacterized protein n=1 Tax=Parasitella parasitica TaxID=35722 RepID=A0A0B7NEM2_9FUNG|nr:hypothetical protein [Parasitella parasitica]